MFTSPSEVLAALEFVGYFTDLKIATAVFLAGSIHRPVLLEGPAGAGKTELAQSVARAFDVPLLRLQCYQGINEEKAIGQYDRSLQELYVLLMSRSGQIPDWAQIKREITSRAYFMAGPLLEAIKQEEPCVLLIDEIDKVDYAFEAMLLELLSVWTLSIPRMGTVRGDFHSLGVSHLESGTQAWRSAASAMLLFGRRTPVRGTRSCNRGKAYAERRRGNSSIYRRIGPEPACLHAREATLDLGDERRRGGDGVAGHRPDTA